MKKNKDKTEIYKIKKGRIKNMGLKEEVRCKADKTVIKINI